MTTKQGGAGDAEKGPFLRWIMDPRRVTVLILIVFVLGVRTIFSGPGIRLIADATIIAGAIWLFLQQRSESRPPVLSDQKSPVRRTRGSGTPPSPKDPPAPN